MYLQEVDEKRGDALAWIGPPGLSAVTAYFGMRDIGTVKPGDRCGTQSRLDVPITSTVLATPMPVTPGSSWIEAAVARHQLLDIIVQSARTGQT